MLSTTIRCLCGRSGTLLPLRTSNVPIWTRAVGGRRVGWATSSVVDSFVSFHPTGLQRDQRQRQTDSRRHRRRHRHRYQRLNADEVDDSWTVPYDALSAEASNIQYTIENVPGHLADELSDHLLCNGALSATILEHRPPGASEEEIFKEKWGVSEFWKTCSVQCCFLFEASENAGNAENAENTLGEESALDTNTQAIATALEWLDAEPSVLAAVTVTAGEIIKPQNWQQAILDEYQEIYITEDLRVVPTWLAADTRGERGEAEKDAASDDTVQTRTTTTDVILNPGIAFGTGDHPTTRMCLQFLNTLRDAHLPSLLDYGTGSGLLAIAALVLNVAQTAHGTDIEPLSIKASVHNAALNNVETRFTAELVSGDAGVVSEPRDDFSPATSSTPNKTYDIICANILQGPLKSLAPLLASKSHAGTVLVLSGITEGQADEIEHAYGQVGFTAFRRQRAVDEDGDEDGDNDGAGGHISNRWVVVTGVYDTEKER